jgi:hypothetical protein
LEGFDSSFGVFEGGPAVEYAVAGVAGDYVEVYVVNKLAGWSAVVAQDVIAVSVGGFDCRLCDFTETVRDLPQKFGRASVQILEVLFGNDQGVAVADRAYIQKRQSNFIFVNLGAGNLAGYDLTEDAIIGTH